jgi:transposase
MTELERLEQAQDLIMQATSLLESIAHEMGKKDYDDMVIAKIRREVTHLYDMDDRLGDIRNRRNI